MSRNDVCVQGDTEGSSHSAPRTLQTLGHLMECVAGLGSPGHGATRRNACTENGVSSKLLTWKTVRCLGSRGAPKSLLQSHFPFS